MKVTEMRLIGTWEDVKEVARNTIGLKGSGLTPDSEWKRKMLACEHSPTRRIKVIWKWEDLPYWVSVHFVRHKIGCEHWVSTQRTDRVKTGINRETVSQDAPVTHMMECDLQAIINISKVRLCTGASPETRQAWKMVLDELYKLIPELEGICVPSCVYRGHCFEYFTCNYHMTKQFKKQVQELREAIN